MGGPQLALGDRVGVSLQLTWKSPPPPAPWRDSLLTLLPGDLEVKPLAFQMEKAGLEGLSTRIKDMNTLPGMEYSLLGEEPPKQCQ